MKIYVVNGDWSEDWGVWNVIDFLWHRDHDVDTDGDPYTPHNWSWIEMYVSNRENKEVVSVVVAQDDPLVVCVESLQTYLCARAAYFLATGSHGQIALALRGVPQKPEFLRAMMGADFDVEAAKRRGSGYSTILDVMLEIFESEHRRLKTELDQEKTSN